MPERAVVPDTALEEPPTTIRRGSVTPARRSGAVDARPEIAVGSGRNAAPVPRAPVHLLHQSGHRDADDPVQERDHVRRSRTQVLPGWCRARCPAKSTANPAAGMNGPGPAGPRERPTISANTRTTGAHRWFVTRRHACRTRSSGSSSDCAAQGQPSVELRAPSQPSAGSYWDAGVPSLSNAYPEMPERKVT